MFPSCFGHDMLVCDLHSNQDTVLINNNAITIFTMANRIVSFNSTPNPATFTYKCPMTIAPYYVPIFIFPLLKLSFDLRSIPICQILLIFLGGVFWCYFIRKSHHKFLVCLRLLISGVSNNTIDGNYRSLQGVLSHNSPNVN